MFLSIAGAWTRWPLRIPSNSQDSVILWSTATTLPCKHKTHLLERKKATWTPEWDSRNNRFSVTVIWQWAKKVYRVKQMKASDPQVIYVKSLFSAFLTTASSLEVRLEHQYPNYTALPVVKKNPRYQLSTIKWNGKKVNSVLFFFLLKDYRNSLFLHSKKHLMSQTSFGKHYFWKVKSVSFSLLKRPFSMFFLDKKEI